MGKNSSFFYAVKKAITCESNQNQNKKNKSRRRGCFRNQRSVNLDAEKAVVLQATRPPPPTEGVKLIEAESEQNRHAYSVALVTAVAAEAAVAAANAAAEIVRLRASVHNNSSGITKEEIAAVKIQASFRGYMARRVLRALRGLMRLKTTVGGKSIERQAAASLKCMQTMVCLQSEIRVRRIRLLDDDPSIQRQMVHDKDLVKPGAYKGENWDVSTRSKEQIEADLHYRKEAAMRRERALAYAYSHQRVKNSPNSTNDAFVETNNPGWGWGWLERWMAGRPWEEGDSAGAEANNTLLAAAKATSSRCIGLRGDTKIQSLTAAGGDRPPSRQSPSTPKSRAGGRIRPSSSRGGIGMDDDSKSLNSTQSEQCRRRSCAGSSMRDDDSLASLPTVPGYMLHTESARARARGRLASPQRSETSSSAKKRLSFSGSPARPRKNSTPTRSAASP